MNSSWAYFLVSIQVIVYGLLLLERPRSYLLVLSVEWRKVLSRVRGVIALMIACQVIFCLFQGFFWVQLAMNVVALTCGNYYFSKTLFQAKSLKCQLIYHGTIALATIGLFGWFIVIWGGSGFYFSVIAALAVYLVYSFQESGFMREMILESEGVKQKLIKSSFQKDFELLN